jgi:hypothetical protein
MSSKPYRSKPHPSDPEFWTVVNELPDPIPVGKNELDAIERYFSDVLDEIIGLKKSRVEMILPNTSKGRDHAA